MHSFHTNIVRMPEQKFFQPPEAHPSENNNGANNGRGSGCENGGGSGCQGNESTEAGPEDSSDDSEGDRNKSPIGENEADPEFPPDGDLDSIFSSSKNTNYILSEDAERLHHLLVHSFSPVEVERKEAEGFLLRVMQSNPAIFLGTLREVIEKPLMNAETRNDALGKSENEKTGVILQQALTFMRRTILDNSFEEDEKADLQCIQALLEMLPKFKAFGKVRNSMRRIVVDILVGILVKENADRDAVRGNARNSLNDKVVLLLQGYLRSEKGSFAQLAVLEFLTEVIENRCYHLITFPLSKSLETILKKHKLAEENQSAACELSIALIGERTIQRKLKSPKAQFAEVARILPTLKNQDNLVNILGRLTNAIQQNSNFFKPLLGVTLVPCLINNILLKGDMVGGQFSPPVLKLAMQCMVLMIQKKPQSCSKCADLLTKIIQANVMWTTLREEEQTLEEWSQEPERFHHYHNYTSEKHVHPGRDTSSCSGSIHTLLVQVKNGSSSKDSKKNSYEFTPASLETNGFDANTYATVAQENLARITRAYPESSANHQKVLSLLEEYISRLSESRKWQEICGSIYCLISILDALEPYQILSSFGRVVVSRMEHECAAVRYATLVAVLEITSPNSYTGGGSGTEGQDEEDSLAPLYANEQFMEEIAKGLHSLVSDETPRVATLALRVFSQFASVCPPPLLIRAAPHFLEKFWNRLLNGKDRVMQEEALGCISVVAEMVESDFAPHYSKVMPLLKQIIASSDSVVGKVRAFDCASMLGYAVGRERFQKDAAELMGFMLGDCEILPADNSIGDTLSTVNTNKKCSTLSVSTLERFVTCVSDSIDDLSHECVVSGGSSPAGINRNGFEHNEVLNQAFSRVCEVLQADFHRFLPRLLPGIFRILSIKPKEICGEDQTVHEVSEMQLVFRDKSCSSPVWGLKTREIEEVYDTLLFLTTLMQSVGTAYVPYVQSTVTVLDGLFDFVVFSEEIQKALFEAWAQLFQCCASDKSNALALSAGNFNVDSTSKPVDSMSMAHYQSATDTSEPYSSDISRCNSSHSLELPISSKATRDWSVVSWGSCSNSAASMSPCSMDGGSAFVTPGGTPFESQSDATRSAFFNSLETGRGFFSPPMSGGGCSGTTPFFMPSVDATSPAFPRTTISSNESVKNADNSTRKSPLDISRSAANMSLQRVCPSKDSDASANDFDMTTAASTTLAEAIRKQQTLNEKRRGFLTTFLERSLRLLQSHDVDDANNDESDTGAQVAENIARVLRSAGPNLLTQEQVSTTLKIVQQCLEKVEKRRQENLAERQQTIIQTDDEGFSTTADEDGFAGYDSRRSSVSSNDSFLGRDSVRLSMDEARLSVDDNFLSTDEDDNCLQFYGDGIQDQFYGDGEEGGNENGLISFRISVVSILGAIMEMSPSEFIKADGVDGFLPFCYHLIDREKPEEDRLLGMYLASDMIEYLCETSVTEIVEKLSEEFWNLCLDNLTDKESSTLRLAAASLVAHASKHRSFSHYANRCIGKLVKHIMKEKRIFVNRPQKQTSQNQTKNGSQCQSQSRDGPHQNCGSENGSNDATNTRKGRKAGKKGSGKKVGKSAISDTTTAIDAEEQDGKRSSNKKTKSGENKSSERKYNRAEDRRQRCLERLSDGIYDLTADFLTDELRQALMTGEAIQELPGFEIGRKTSSKKRRNKDQYFADDMDTPFSRGNKKMLKPCSSLKRGSTLIAPEERINFVDPQGNIEHGVETVFISDAYARQAGNASSSNIIRTNNHGSLITEPATGVGQLNFSSGIVNTNLNGEKFSLNDLLFEESGSESDDDGPIMLGRNGDFTFIDEMESSSEEEREAHDQNNALDNSIAALGHLLESRMNGQLSEITIELDRDQTNDSSNESADSNTDNGRRKMRKSITMDTRPMLTCNTNMQHGLVNDAGMLDDSDDYDSDSDNDIHSCSECMSDESNEFSFSEGEIIVMEQVNTKERGKGKKRKTHGGMQREKLVSRKGKGICSKSICGHQKAKKVQKRGGKKKVETKWNQSDLFELWCQCLPLQHDSDEAVKTHSQLLRLASTSGKSSQGQHALQQKSQQQNSLASPSSSLSQNALLASSFQTGAPNSAQTILTNTFFPHALRVIGSTYGTELLDQGEACEFLREVSQSVPGVCKVPELQTALSDASISQIA